MNRVISVLKTSALISSLAAGGHAVHYFSEQAKGKNDHPKVEIAPVEHPQEGLQRLLAGNERFVQGMSVHPDQTFARIKATENGQNPMLSWSPARTAASLPRYCLMRELAIYS